jgi:MSHA biogenesis protein MshI
MKQRINLYVRQEKVRIPFSGAICLLILLVTAGAMATAYGVTARGLAETQARLAGLTTEKASLQAEIDRLNRERRQLVPSPALEAREAGLERELTAKQGYLALLDSLQPERRTAFSTLLLGLAEQDLPGLWLTRIQAGEGGRTFRLEGGVLQAGLVPRYLERLGAEPGYRQARFDGFSLNEGEGGLRFQLQALLVPGAGDER